ncbi:ryncolin-2 isoform X2 [Exaiptasia diaphana]|uniref:Fibrinogen C-terminal domain-containing protein n=1 Tax=Exaiptasia diaphana TaxID=2652724 RepID=A0A913XSV0_EXADI|nr:ryncolin-2 isoform X2 [Exaiptasia diaphana]
MKVYMLFALLQLSMVEQKFQAASAVTVNNYISVGGSNSTLLVKLMRSLLSELKKTNVVAKNCYDVLQCGGKQSGVYSVNPDGKGEFQVYCDQKTSGGGWTVIQKRKDGSVDFYRGWNDYKNGFGDLKGEFWLGLDKINRLTHQVKNRLRVDLEDTKGKGAYAEYDYFAVASEQSKYKLGIGTYSGTAGDSLSGHRNFAFSTKDQDNDANSGSCAVLYKGAWWYTSCHGSNLNGLYHHGQHKSYADGVNWSAWKGHNYSAKKAEMKIKPANIKRK